MTIGIFGDSIAKGIITDQNKISIYENNPIKRLSANKKIEVLNFSRFGQTLKKAYERNIFQEFIANNSNGASLAFISLGGNDVSYDWPKVASNPTLPHQPKTALKDFISYLNQTITVFEEAKIKVVLTTIIPVSSKKYYDNVIGNQTEKAKVLEFLCGDIENIERQQECYNLAILNTARDRGIEVLDIRSSFLMRCDYQSLLCEDGIHPNKKGYDFLYEVIKGKMNQFF